MDNTFATPLNQRPLDIGATVAVQATTKFIGGHSDLLGGVATTKDETLADAIRRSRTLGGAVPGALEAFLAVRGVAFWHEAWAEDWHSDTVWRVPLWIPYLSLPVGMGILSLQYVADILSLLSGRDLPFGLPAKAGPLHTPPFIAPEAHSEAPR